MSKNQLQVLAVLDYSTRCGDSALFVGEETQASIDLGLAVGYLVTPRALELGCVALIGSRIKPIDFTSWRQSQGLEVSGCAVKYHTSSGQISSFEEVQPIMA